VALLFAKAAALFLFLLVLVFAVPAFALLLVGPSLGPPLLGLIAVLVLADVGLAVIGTLVSAIAVQTRPRDLIGPVIGLPLLLPRAAALGRRVRVPVLRDGGWRQMADGLRRCAACRGETSVTAGTIFAGTRTPMVSWFAAVWYVVKPEAGRQRAGAAAGARPG
jgi:hypothetical protein